MTNTEQVRLVIELAKAVADCIKEAGDQGIPSGHLYAACMGKMSLHTYQQLIERLKQLGIIRQNNNVLYYVSAH